MRNLLGLRQRYLLSNWLMKNKGRLLSKRPPKIEVAEEVTEILKFKITESNVRAHCRDLEIDWTAKRQGISMTTNKSVILAKAIVWMADELGIKNKLNEDVVKLSKGDTPSNGDEDDEDEEDEEEEEEEV